MGGRPHAKQGHNTLRFRRNNDSLTNRLDDEEKHEQAPGLDYGNSATWSCTQGGHWKLGEETTATVAYANHNEKLVSMWVRMRLVSMLQWPPGRFPPYVAALQIWPSNNLQHCSDAECLNIQNHTPKQTSSST